MKYLILTILMVWASFAARADLVNPIQVDPVPQPVKIDIKKREPVQMASVSALRTYAVAQNYYYQVNLREGMRVLYSASYGMGGEAGQAAGTLVYRDGRFWFKQQKNPTGQLLLPPGLTLSSNADHSLWDVGAYMELVNRVAFSDPNQVSHTANDIYGKPDAALVDFDGGTAGSSVTYRNALEIVFKKQVANRSDSEMKVYYAKGIGPVALEFRENLTPAGTFKLYIGD